MPVVKLKNKVPNCTSYVVPENIIFRTQECNIGMDCYKGKNNEGRTF